MGERIAKGGAFPLLVESSPLFYTVRGCFSDRAEGRLPYQEKRRPSSARPLLGWCAVGLVSALPVAHPGRRRPGEAAPPRREALVKGAGATSGVEPAHRCSQPSNPPHQTQGRLGPHPGEKQSNSGVSKGISLWWVFGDFLAAESHPAEFTRVGDLKRPLAGGV